ncbi:TPA: type I pullulanase [Streptococcus pneumoniae]|uniref:type I pullulanase n=1 Tax=Streptococcus pneumoniae TaxID=1313 RepID=UPI0010D5A442|nr:pullulanase [Streptococcus pneumoniae]VKH46458.1 pullulanase [Streptococcus pneumoniae]VMX99472.1 pullulanase [Streptococcus pneumoniae]VOE77239.1 pullulanase [Streptococcus pneumoniae]VOH45877.1 pullulanase [Streptococcus pneumoniae]
MYNYPMRIHYHRKNGEYDTCSFVKSKDQRIDLLTYKEDYFGALFSFEHPSAHLLESLNFVVHTGQTSKEYAIRFNHYPLLTEVWILEGDDRIYYSENPAIASPFYKNQNPFAFDKAINSASFDHHWGYQGELGCRVEDNQAHFALWAPTATEVQVVVYESATNDAPVWKTFVMERGNSYSYNHKDNTIGVWSLDVEEDLTGKAYQYQVQFPHHQTLTRDPYTIATSPDGKRSAILSHVEKQVENFEVKHGSEATWRLTNPCKAVICEMHIRDLTKSPTSGVDEHLRGTFLGAAQTGTVNQYGQATAFDYIKKLGYNYVQLQPIADRHKEYDEDGNVTYNWGYDPQNYNAPETSFSTNPDDPAQVIRDLKVMVQAYHDAGIGVIMDVVYNHTFSVVDAPFQTTVPDYYYRMNPDGTFQNGTGVGNETASEHEMFRKYMIDSLLYWVQEYNIDGFRFDLMGIHDVKTMQMIRQSLDEIDSNIILYGEGWDMGTGLAPYDKAKKDNAYQMPNIGFFNDNQRDAVKGGEVYGAIKSGFVSGAATEPILAKAILGSRELGSYTHPNQVLNYVEAHDNYNLHDLLATLHPDQSSEQIMRKVETATAMNLLMQGMAFMEIGQEFGRTKLVATGENGELTHDDRERAMNSYNAPDSVNQVNWNLINERQDSIEFIRQVIRLKTKTGAFSYSSYDEIYHHVFVHSAIEHSGCLIYEVHGKEHLLVVVNAKSEPYQFENAGNLAMLVTNSRSKEDNVLNDISLAVLSVL